MSDQITNEPPEVWRCLICAWENSVEPLPEGGGMFLAWCQIIS